MFLNIQVIRQLTLNQEVKDSEKYKVHTLAQVDMIQQQYNYHQLEDIPYQIYKTQK